MMQVTSGQQYTFNFDTSGIPLNVLESLSSEAIKSLQDAAFPIANPTGSDVVGIGGGFSISFTYNGTDTDDQSLGQAMASALTNDFTTLSFTYTGATAGPQPFISVSPTGALSQIGTQIKNAWNGITPSLPSPSTIGVVVVIVLLLAVAVYSFAGAAGHEAAARV